MSSAGAARLQEIVEATCSACFGLEWTLGEDGSLAVTADFNTPWRIESAKAAGMPELYTKASARFTFKPEQGAVGKVFSEQKVVFVQDLQALSETEVCGNLFGSGVAFMRSHLAKEYDIQSTMFVPLPNGVIEVGALRKFDNAGDFMDQALVDAIQKGAPIPPPSAAGDAEPSRAADPRLQKLVSDSQGASFAIEWVLGDDGSLKFGNYYNPPWRVQEMKARGSTDLYTTKSASYTFGPSEGYVGKVFSAQKPSFIPDLQALSEDDARDAWLGPATEFLRADLARQFNIHSAIYLPLPTGVIEIGASRKVPQWSDLLPQATMQAAGLAFDGF